MFHPGPSAPFSTHLSESSHTPSSSDSVTTPSLLSSQPLLVQYLFFFLLVLLSTLAFHIPIRVLCWHTPRVSFPLTSLRPLNAFFSSSSPFPHYPHPTPLSTALLVSSCTKLFPLLLIIWEYDLPSAATAVSWAVFVNNVAALEILMDCGYFPATLLVVIAALFRACIAGIVLRAVGLGAAWQSGGVGWFG